jgi:hypothetical protein
MAKVSRMTREIPKDELVRSHFERLREAKAPAHGSLACVGNIQVRPSRRSAQTEGIAADIDTFW